MRPLALALVILAFAYGETGMAQSKKRWTTTRQGAASRVPLLPGGQGADMVLLGGKVWAGTKPTGKGAASEEAQFAQAVAIAGGRILAVGRNSQVSLLTGENTKVIQLGGRLVIPGFVDAHAHFLGGGFQLMRIDLKGAKSEAEFVRRIGEKAKSLPPGRWLLGGNWMRRRGPPPSCPRAGRLIR